MATQIRVGRTLSSVYGSELGLLCYFGAVWYLWVWDWTLPSKCFAPRKSNWGQHWISTDLADHLISSFLWMAADVRKYYGAIITNTHGWPRKYHSLITNESSVMFRKPSQRFATSKSPSPPKYIWNMQMNVMMMISRPTKPKDEQPQVTRRRAG